MARYKCDFYIKITPSHFLYIVIFPVISAVPIIADTQYMILE